MMHPDNDHRYIAAYDAIREAERFIQRARTRWTGHHSIYRKLS